MQLAADKTYRALLETAWRSDIRPVLAGMEAERKSTLLKAAIVTVGLLTMVLIAGYSLGLAGSHGGESAFDIMVMACVMACMPGFAMLVKLKERVKAEFVQRLLATIGWQLEPEASEPPAFEDYMKFKMLPWHNERNFEDRLRGQHRGAQFDMTEVHLKKRSGKRAHTVFRGFALSVDFHQTFASTTIVIKDSKFRNRRRIGDLKRVGMASPKWEALFEAYSNDQVEARVKLDPAFMERLMRLEESVDGKNIRFAFFASRLHVICETANRYEPGHLFKRLDDPRRFENITREVDALVGVLDGIMSETRSVAQSTSQLSLPLMPDASFNASAVRSPLPGLGLPNPYV